MPAFAGMTELGPAKAVVVDYSGRLLRTPVAQQFARRSASAFVFSKRLNAVDDNGTISLRALHATPFAARQIVHDLTDPIGFDAEPVHVIDYDVSPCAF